MADPTYDPPQSRCAFCDELRADPDEFHDGLRCIYCAAADEEASDGDG